MARKKKTEEQKKAEEEKTYFGTITLLVPDEMGVMKNLNGEIKLVDTLTKTKNPKKIKGQPSIILKEDKNIKQAKLIDAGVSVKEKQGETLTEAQKQGLEKMKQTLKKVNQEKGKKQIKKYVKSIQDKEKFLKVNTGLKQTLESIKEGITEAEETLRSGFNREYDNNQKFADILKGQQSEYNKIVNTFEEFYPDKLNKILRREELSAENRKEAERLIELSKTTMDKLIKEQRVIIKKIKNETGRKSKII
jgi:hypothetical protein